MLKIVMNFVQELIKEKQIFQQNVTFYSITGKGNFDLELSKIKWFYMIHYRTNVASKLFEEV